MDAHEFAEWIAYDQIEPFGGTREDQRAGVVASAIVNLHRKKSQTALNWSDFLPSYEQRVPQQNWSDLLLKASALNQALGGRDLRKKKHALEE